MLNILSAEVRWQPLRQVVYKVLIHMPILIKHLVNKIDVLFVNLFGCEAKSPYGKQRLICRKFIYLYTKVLDEGNQDL